MKNFSQLNFIKQQAGRSSAAEVKYCTAVHGVSF